jgi:hypothetical protein
VQKSKDFNPQEKREERSADGPVGRPEESTEQTITTWARVAQLVKHECPGLKIAKILSRRKRERERCGFF